MKMHTKSIIFICSLAMLLTGCTDNATSSQESTTASQTEASSAIGTETPSVDSEINDTSVTASEISDEDRTPVKTGENPITLNGDSVSYNGNGVTIDGTTVTITAPGTYTVSGKLNDGRIIVNCAEKGNVSLVLNGVDITCSNSSPIYVMQTKKAIITLAEGTDNKLSDGTAYTFADSEEEPEAVIYSKDDLVLNGSGTLTVNANYKDGIVSKDTLVIADGSYTINAVNNAVKGKDYAVVGGGSLNITCGGNGIKSTNDTDSALGYVAVYGGNITINSTGDGIQAYTNVKLAGGTLDIITNGGASANTTSHNDNMGGGFGWDRNGTTDADTDDTPSCKGIKAGGSIFVNDGEVTLDTNDDALHCAATAAINDGKISAKTGDDGIHADSTITINGGEINIEESYEGIEALVITVNDGVINVTASDDGFNVNGEETGFGGRGGFGGQTETEESSDGTNVLTINGGVITVNAFGDGLDSNGSMIMTGGDVTVYGPTNSGNGTLDYGSTFLISGGVLKGAGSAGMAQSPSASSAQASITVGGSFTEGQKLTLKDENGNEVINFTALRDCQSLVLSAPQIENGKTYTFFADDTEIGTVTLTSQLGAIGDQVSGFGGMGGKPNGGRQGKRNEDGTITLPDGSTITIPEGNSDGTLPEGFEEMFPDGFDGTLPEGITPPDDETLPDNFGGMKPPSTQKLPSIAEMPSDNGGTEADIV